PLPATDLATIVAVQSWPGGLPWPSIRISPGIIFTPLAKDELTGPRGAGYRRMLELSPVGRGGPPDEVATVAALLMGPDGAFITGSDVLMDGGVTAAWFFGDLAPP